MPSISSTDNRRAGAASGTLFVVATPIGNLEDITLRALSVLKAADLIAAEDTRKTAQLLKHFGIASTLISYHEHNEAVRAPQLVRRLQSGDSIALVTNAGTPGVSDPGYRLVAAASAAGIRVVPVPGALAAAAALSASGLPTDAFVFEGFLPRKSGKRLKRIQSLAAEPRTVILYESPQRIIALIGDLLQACGDRPAAMAREMTKIHEEFIRGRLSEVLKVLKGRAEIKGECTLIVAGRTEQEPSSWETAREMIRTGLGRHSKGLSELVKDVAHAARLPRKAVYAEAMKIKSEQLEPDQADRQ
jgi:16S rRNA (cytidine1402-2'-O)-methyltransferase